MELRVLHYFLAVAREQSISAAAPVLAPDPAHPLHPAESPGGGAGQAAAGTGHQGLPESHPHRGGHDSPQARRGNPHLGEQGEEEIAHSDDTVVGTVSIGGRGDGHCAVLRQGCPDPPKAGTRTSATKSPAATRSTCWNTWTRASIDFGLIFGEVDQRKYQSLPLPAKDTWGVLMRRDPPLAEKEAITPQDLWDKPLLLSHQRGGQRGPVPLA